MSAVILTVTPNPSVDRTLDVTSLVSGAVNRATGAHVEPSGKGVNVTRALAANGVRSRAVLPLGGTEGDQLRRLLAEESVAYVGVPVTEPVRVNISLRTPDGVVTKVNEPGPILSWAEAEALAEAVLAHLGRGDWVVGAGTLPRGVSDDFYADLAERVRLAGGRFALDSSGAALRKGLAGRPALVKPNRDELAELTGDTLSTLGDVLTAAAKVRRTTGADVLVSLGEEGAVLVGGGPPLRARAGKPVRVASTVGAGDNLLAGFLAVDGPPAHRLREAVAWGTTAVRSPRSLAGPVTDDDRALVVLG